MGFKQGAYTPESEREERLVEDLHIATRRAHKDGMAKHEIYTS